MIILSALPDLSHNNDNDNDNGNVDGLASNEVDSNGLFWHKFTSSYFFSFDP